MIAAKNAVFCLMSPPSSSIQRGARAEAPPRTKSVAGRLDAGVAKTVNGAALLGKETSDERSPLRSHPPHGVADAARVAARRPRGGRREEGELAEAYLARIDRLAPALKAFVTVTRDRALEQARRAEKEIAAGKNRGPLHGVPYATKDLPAIKGVRTTWGATPFAAQTFDYDATLVGRLEEASAVLLGTLAIIELAGGLGYTVPWASATGAARNPWDTGKWSCGSSSGSGAAVSAGLVGFALGSDTWGSI